jgi:hypothetical protein
MIWTCLNNSRLYSAYSTEIIFSVGSNSVIKFFKTFNLESFPLLVVMDEDGLYKVYSKYTMQNKSLLPFKNEVINEKINEINLLNI